jgi:tetratricopeptide (TPR) repeat protein
MQKLVFSIALAFFAFVANAQSAEDVAKMLDKKKFKEAKEGIDKLTANSNDAYAWLLKAQVYNAISTDEALKASVPDACETSFEAYKKAYDANPNLNQIKLDFYQTAYRAYDCVGSKAAMAFQSSKYPEALDTYKKLLSYGNYLNSKNLTNNGYPPKFDTAVIFYVGYIAMKLDKEEDAVTYFSKIANAKIGKDADYIIPYQFLAYTFKEKKDEENFKKYANLGSQLYPTSPYFAALKIDWGRDNNNYQEIFAGYDELIPLQPDSMKHYLIYANDIFEYAFVKNPDKRPDDFEKLAPKVDSLLKITLAHGYDSLNSYMLLTGLYYNQGLDLASAADKIKTSTKPDDVKKRKDLMTKAIAYYDKAIPYAEHAVKLMEVLPQSGMKSSEKQRLKNLYGWLSDMYRAKGNKPKTDEFDKKWDAVNLK